MDHHLRSAVEALRGTVEQLDHTDLGIYQRSGGKLDFRTALDMDLLSFLMALGNGDGRVDDAEAAEISEILGWKVSAAELNDFAAKHNLSAEPIRQRKIPLSLRALTDADLAIARQRFEDNVKGTAQETGNFAGAKSVEYLDDGDNYIPASILFYDLCVRAGGAVIYSNENVDETENADYTEYLAAIRDYIEDRLSLEDEEFAKDLAWLQDDHFGD